MTLKKTCNLQCVSISDKKYPQTTHESPTHPLLKPCTVRKISAAVRIPSVLCKIPADCANALFFPSCVFLHLISFYRRCSYSHRLLGPPVSLLHQKRHWSPGSLLFDSCLHLPFHLFGTLLANIFIIVRTWVRLWFRRLSSVPLAHIHRHRTRLLQRHWTNMFLAQTHTRCCTHCNTLLI